MLLFFLTFLRETLGLKVPTVFEYCSTRMALASITALLFTIFSGKFFIKKLYELKIGESVRTEHCPLLGELHRNKNDTPTMGGILILSALLLSLFLWMDPKNSFTLILFLTTVTIGLLGATDDYLKLRYKNKKGISGKVKLLIQGGVSFLIALYLLTPSFSSSMESRSWYTPPIAKEVVDASSLKIVAEGGTEKCGLALLKTHQYSSRLYLPFMKHPLFTFTGAGLLLLALFIAFVITGASNAVNLTDGLDGLATGTVMLSASAFALIAFISNHFDLASYLNILYIEGSGEIAIYLAALAGACLGFLWYNGHPAQVFMGDTGSLPLGAILGVSSVLLKKELLFGIIGGVFVIEAFSVVLQVGSYKLRDKKRLFLCSPLHHHFEYKGWAETKVVVRFWIIGLLFAIVGIASLKFQ